MAATTKDPQAEMENIIKRIIYFKNPYDVLDLPSSATVDEIQKKYKKLALQLHPDKCKHPKAQDAFNALNRANKILQEAAIRTRYGEIMAQSRQLVEDEEKKKERPKTGSLLEYEIKLRTHKILLELEVYNQNAEKYRQVNERRVKDEEVSKKMDEKKKEEIEKEWEEGRVKRVEDWRKFVNNKDDKKRKAASELKPPKLKQQH